MGIIFLIIAWLAPQLVAVPAPIETLLYDGGIILIVVGIILLVLSFVFPGRVGAGFRGSGRWY